MKEPFRKPLTILAVLLAGCLGGKPATPPKPETGQAARASPHGAPGFDQKDLERTWSWVLAKGREMEEVHANDVGREKLRAQVAKDMAEWHGRQVSWLVNVERVNRGEKNTADIVLRSKTAPVSFDEHMTAEQEALLMEAYPRSKILFYQLSLKSCRPGGGGSSFFSAPADDWIAELKGGSSVLLEGTIDSTAVRQSGDLPIYEFSVCLRDYSLKQATGGR